METFQILPEQYPVTLRQLGRLPPRLYCVGRPPPSSEEFKYLCVIGARKYSSYGKDACIKLIAGLHGYRIVIVSGLAIGIDSIAHEAALDAELMTIAFPGSGLDRNSIYPRSHVRLAERIVASGGTLLSPFEPDQIGAPWTFPVRNILMAGISHATLIIEGRKDSGTLQAARAALEFGRDVMVVPGSIFSELSHGPHSLMIDGATPISSSEEILRAMGFEAEQSVGGARAENAARILSSLPPEANDILLLLQTGPLSATGIIEKTGISPDRFNVIISELELESLVVQNDGMYRLDKVTDNFAI